MIRIVFLFFLSFSISYFNANAQFDTTHHLGLVNCVKNRFYFAIPVTLIATGTILSNSNFKINLQKNVVGNTKTKVDNYLQIAPAGITIGLEAIGIKGSHKPLQPAMIFSISNVILNSIVQPIKHFTKIKRPDNSDFKSFPSGHTTEAFAAAELMRLEFKEDKPWLGYAGYLMAGATGYLRMYNNKHWISDVLAGAGIGIGSTKLALLVFDKIDDNRRFKKYIKGNSMVLTSYQQNQICINWIKRL